MTAKLQNAEPLMAPDLRVKAMKEAYAGRGAARLAIGLAGCDSLGATMAYVCIRPYIHTSMHTYTHIYILYKHISIHTHIRQARGNGKTSIVKLNIS